MLPDGCGGVRCRHCFRTFRAVAEQADQILNHNRCVRAEVPMRLSHQRHDRSAASRDARANCGRNGASSGASACFAKLPHLREGEPRGPVRGIVKRSMEAMGGRAENMACWHG